MNSTTRVLLIGAAGRMGKTVVALARNDRQIDIVAQCDLGDSIELAMENCDVAIDFSHADAITEVCRAALHHAGRLSLARLDIHKSNAEQSKRQRGRWRLCSHRIS